MLHNWPWWLEGEKYLWAVTMRPLALGQGEKYVWAEIELVDLAAFTVVGRHKVGVHNTLSHFEILYGGLSRGRDG